MSQSIRSYFSLHSLLHVLIQPWRTLKYSACKTHNHVYILEYSFLCILFNSSLLTFPFNCPRKNRSCLFPFFKYHVCACKSSTPVLVTRVFIAGGHWVISTVAHWSSLPSNPRTRLNSHSAWSSKDPLLGQHSRALFHRKQSPYFTS